MTDKDGNYKVEVIADNSGEFCGNGLKFETIQAAIDYAQDLYCRWTAVKTWQVVQIDNNEVVTSMK
jgi:hypothetical protein